MPIAERPVVHCLPINSVAPEGRRCRPFAVCRKAMEQLPTPLIKESDSR